jgi:integrase
VIRVAGLPEIRFHDLRHNAASLMINHGVPIIVVSRRLGHSRASITLDTYSHLIPEIQSEAAEIIDDLVMPVEIEWHPIGTQIPVD